MNSLKTITNENNTSFEKFFIDSIKKSNSIKMSVVSSSYPNSDRNALNDYRQELKAQLLAQNEKLVQELFFAQRCVNSQLEKNKTLMEKIETKLLFYQFLRKTELT